MIHSQLHRVQTVSVQLWQFILPFISPDFVHNACIHSFIHSFSSVQFSSFHFSSFIHSFIHSAEQAACTAEERVHNRVNLCACTGEENSACTAEAPPPNSEPGQSTSPFHFVSDVAAGRPPGVSSKSGMSDQVLPSLLGMRDGPRLRLRTSFSHGP